MAKDQGKVRPLRAVRSDAPAPADDAPVQESAESLLPGLPRIGALDALLREVDGLRLTLETDLTLAASAVENGSMAIARDIIDNDIANVRRFESRSLDQLAELSAADLVVDRDLADDVRASWWRRVPATPFVAAAAVVGVLLIAVPHTGNPTPQVNAANVTASERLQQISELASSGQTNEIRNAAASLHGQLLKLVAEARTDPLAARAGLQLLSDERSIITRSGDSAALTDVLADSANLSRLIIAHLPPAIRPTIPPIKPVPVTQPTAGPTTGSSPSRKPSATPSAGPTTKPSSTPTAKPTSTPAPASTGKPSPTPASSSGVLPANPALQ